jgi:lipid-A-disaccharide synthase
MRVFFSTGEASGDAYAAAIAQRLKGDFELEGIVGARGQAAGISPVADNRSWGSIGVLESLKVAPRAMRGYWAAIAWLKRGQPGLCVLIDYGYMNIRLARRAQALGWKTLYFVPPGSWRRDRQGGDLAKIADVIVTPFEWSAEILRANGANAFWFGHPIKQLISESGGEPRERHGIAVLPGSRIHEVENNVPAIALALRGYEGVVRLSCSPNVDRAELIELWKKSGGGEVEVVTELYPALKASRAAVVCSGTATLESTLCGCPTVVVYRVSKLMVLEYRVLRPKIKFISLPNVLLDRALVPELIHFEATPERIRSELDAVLVDGAARQAQLDGIAELDRVLGGDRAIDRTVELMLETL